METKRIIIAAGAVLALTFGLTSWTTVNEGYRGVYLVAGKARPDAMVPGLHLKAPVVSEVRELDIRQKKYTAQTSASSKDLQTVNTAIALNYKPDPAAIPKPSTTR